MKRNFTIQSSSLGVKGCRYSDIVPMNVAKKVAKNLFQNYKVSKIVFCIRETTKNSKKKQYHYIAIRKKDIIKVKSDNKTIRGGNGKEDIFNRRREARIALCNYMVDYVLHCSNYYQEHIDEQRSISMNIRNGILKEHIDFEIVYNENLDTTYCNLFKELYITCKKNENNINFTLVHIFLMEDEERKIERGGNLQYAIMQGLKMGIILLTAQRNNNITYNLIRPNPQSPAVSYLKNIEQFLEYDGKFTTIHLTKCIDNIHFYWNISRKNNDDIKFVANGKDYPLIIYNKEPLFMPDSKVAILISDHVISLVFQIILNNIPLSSSKTISDVLVQAVFQSLQINILNDTLHIKMVYNEAFIKINIIEHVIDKFCNFYYKYQNKTIKKIRVLQCCGNECQTQNKSIKSN
jgi:hypothetical protein